ncbi:Protein yippee-like [Linum grandiflorum]
MAPSRSKTKVWAFDFVEGRSYNCRQCHLYIASESQKSPSAAFQVINNGQADLFTSVSPVNVIYGPLRQQMMEGRPFGGRDVRCASCNTIIGWEYQFVGLADFYRRGRVQLERNRVYGPDA